MAGRCGSPGSGSFRCVSVLAKRNQIPHSLRRRSLLPKNIEVPVIGANHIKDALWVVPLVQHRFDVILSSFEPEPNRLFVSFSARITFHIQLNQFHYLTKPQLCLELLEICLFSDSVSAWKRQNNLARCHFQYLRGGQA